MKTLLIFLLLPSLLSAQLTGIGIFKIGNTKKYILDEIKKTTGKELVLYEGVMAEYKVTINKVDRTEYVTGLVGEIMFPGENIDTKKDPFRQDINVNYYTVSGIPIQYIQLYFYKDTLIRFRCKGSDLLFQALSTKYGQPKFRVEKDTVKCRSKSAGTFDLMEAVNYYSWDSIGDNISTEYADGIKYDSKCEKDDILYFKVEDKQKWLATQRISFPETKIDKSTLKDF